MIQFPNLDLDVPPNYTQFSQIEETFDISDVDLESATIRTLFDIYDIAVDNAYTTSYKIFDIDSNNPAAHDYFGMAQLLSDRYWSGCYFSYRALYHGRNRAQLELIVDRLDEFCSNTDSNEYETTTPIFPVDNGEDVGREQLRNEYKQLESKILPSFDSGEEIEKLAQLNLSFASKILRTIRSEVETGNKDVLSDDISQLYLAETQIHTLQPEKARKTLQNISYESETYRVLPQRLLANTYAMEGEYESAADTISQLEPDILNDRSDLVSDAITLYKWAGAADKLNDMAAQYLMSEALGQAVLSRQEKLIQMSGRVRGIPPILLSTISKSGSTFLYNSVNERLVIPKTKVFTQTNYDDYQIIPDALDQFAKGGCVCRQHFPPTDKIFESLESRGIDRVVFHVRDPRRALISWVFYQEASLRQQDNLGNKIRTDIRDYASYDFEQKIQDQITAFLEPTIDLMTSWLEAQENQPQGIQIKVTRFEDMIQNPDAFFEDLFDFYNIKQRKWVTRMANSIRQESEGNKNKKRDGNVDEWEEYISPAVQSEVVATIPSSVRDLYPTISWEEYEAE